MDAARIYQRHTGVNRLAGVLVVVLVCQDIRRVIEVEGLSYSFSSLPNSWNALFMISMKDAIKNAR